MATITSCEAPIIDNPQGVDYVCQQIQLELASKITWLEKSYGKALVIRDNREGKDYTIPKVYLETREFIDLEPTDSIKGFSFMYETPGQSEKVGAGISEQQTNINLVVFANTERIKSINEDYLFIERLKNEVLNVLNKFPFFTTNADKSSLEIFKHFDDTWTEFDVNNKNSKWMKTNYATFRINFDVSYLFDCTTL